MFSLEDKLLAALYDKFGDLTEIIFDNLID